ncbi:MAG TPA: hypothetical protein EYP31_09955, partial [Roseibacterium sp.]|nr:hypothetical protein [Roseibacterium sp.]
VGSFRKSDIHRRLVASNHITNGGASAFSSAAGPPDTNTRAGVDLGAASEISHTVPGVLAAGTHSGSRVRLSGTSAAAPQVARWIALALAKPNVAPLRKTLITEAANSAAPFFEDSFTPERTGARLLLGPGAR